MSTRRASPEASSSRPHRRTVFDAPVSCSTTSGTVHPRTVGEGPADHGPGAGDGHLVGDGLEEPGHDQPLRHPGLHAPRFEVVLLILVHRPHRRAGAALYV